MNVEDSVRALAAQTADECGCELVEIHLSGRGKRRLLRAVIDKEGGVTLGDCESFSKSLSALLDVEDPIAGPYTLEVSSPGLDRPLKSTEDFRKSIGKLVRIVTREKIGNRTFFVGRLLGVSDETLRLSPGDDGEDIFIPITMIAKARLEIELK
ncbi:MAG: ribosome maturation factor RimP [Nitrospirae bacterium]|nr:ribosome maturation factor RimP [Nitrospirota bacterium]